MTRRLCARGRCYTPARRGAALHGSARHGAARHGGDLAHSVNIFSLLLDHGRLDISGRCGAGRAKRVCWLTAKGTSSSPSGTRMRRPTQASTCRHTPCRWCQAVSRTRAAPCCIATHSAIIPLHRRAKCSPTLRTSTVLPLAGGQPASPRPWSGFFRLHAGRVIRPSRSLCAVLRLPGHTCVVRSRPHAHDTASVQHRWQHLGREGPSRRQPHGVLAAHRTAQPPRCEKARSAVLNAPALWRCLSRCAKRGLQAAHVMPRQAQHVGRRARGTQHAAPMLVLSLAARRVHTGPPRPSYIC